MHSSSGTGAVRTAALRITGFLEVAHALIDAGRPLDLSGFEAEVGRLCAQALDLPPDEGRALVPALSALLAEIDGTDAALARRDS
jgi:hypothetical protein